VARWQAAKARNHGSVSGRGKGFPLLQSIQKALGMHPASSAMGTRGTFLVDYAAGM